MLALSVRPLLVDPYLGIDNPEKETVVFGAPGRATLKVPKGQLYFTPPGEGTFYLSVAFQNVGPGIAAITKAYTEPEIPGEVKISRRFVPTDGLVRVNVSVLLGLAGTERFSTDWWAMGGLSLFVEYTDSTGEQRLASEAVIRQYATQGPFIEEVVVYELYRNRRRLISRGRGGY
ncbi:hypothetical protein [Methylacidiphilum caldifontis]|nr:hypothetical protein [Methylacidiphilum caldifontis]